jgi:hypothetical protein
MNELGPGVSIMASSSAPRRGRASVTFVFCESNAFGDLAADLKDRERWLRLPIEERPPPPRPRPASRQMWLLPELPPGQRETDEMIPRAWDHSAMITAIEEPVELSG